MNDRRGHRKLRLTSRKHFKPKKSCDVPETSNDMQFKSIGDVEEVNELMISLPLSVYSDNPTSSVESLQTRLRSYGTLPSGMELSLCAY